MIMVTASFSGIIRTIIILILIFYAIKFLLRIFAPVIIQQVVKKAEQNFYNQQNYNNAGQQRQNQSAQQPFTAKVHDKPREKKKVGEYIDYEEIE